MAMAQDGLLQRIGMELDLCSKKAATSPESDAGLDITRNRDKPDAENDVDERAKSRTRQKNLPLSGQQSVREEATGSKLNPGDTDLSSFLATQKQQTELMKNLLSEFATIKANVKQLNSLANETAYADVSDSDEDIRGFVFTY